MHRSTRVPYMTFGGLAMALLLGGLARPDLFRAQAQPPKQETKESKQPSALIIPIGKSVPIQMSTGKRIVKVENPSDTVARVQQVNSDDTRVLVTGLEAGVTTLTLTDVDGKQEKIDIVVQQDIEYLRTLIKRTAPSANVDPIPGSNNTIIMNGVVSRAEDIETIMSAARAVSGAQAINHMRVAGVQQVELCCTVALVSRSEFRRMAFNFLGDTKKTFFGSTLAQAVSNPAVVGATSSTLSIGGLVGGVPGTPNAVNTNLFFGVLNDHNGLITFLQALRDENVVKTLAEPKLTAMSGRPASFLSGGEQAVPIPAGLGQVGVQFEEFGTRLNFLPVVMGGGKIRLEVEPEVSALNPAFGTTIQGTVVPGRTTQRVHTTVELEDGQTFVIGGLIQRDVVGSTTKVPVLGDLPFIGAAFSSKAFNETESELVILVTPHLVDAMACNQVLKALPGQETRSPDDFELFLEGILEAPRGQRDVNFPCGYQPAYKNGPTASRFPCGESLLGGRAGSGACGTGNCATGAGGAANHGDRTSSIPMTPSPDHAASDTNSLPVPAAPASDDARRREINDVPPSPVPPTTTRPTILPPALSGPEGDNGQP